MEDVLAEHLDMERGVADVPSGAGLGVELDPEALDRLSQLSLRESVFYDEIGGHAPRVGQIL
jgi:hypothetical protein